MEHLEYYVQKKTAIDGKEWWCVCYKGITDKICVESRHKRKKDAEWRKNKLEEQEKERWGKWENS